VRWSL